MAYLDEYITYHEERLSTFRFSEQGSEGQQEDTPAEPAARNEVRGTDDPDLQSSWEDATPPCGSPEALYAGACRRYHVTPSTLALQQLALTSLTLCHQGLRAPDIRALAIGLVKNDFVSRINLHNNDIGVGGINALEQMLVANTAITELDVSYNGLGSGAGAAVLGRLVRANIRVTALSAAGNGFGEMDAAIFGDILREVTWLRQLDLSNNSFRESGGIVIADGLATNSGLEQLDLSWNHLRLKGAISLAQAMKENVSLRELVVAWNGFSNDGAAAIGGALKVNETLQDLDLTCNRINLEGAVAIAEGIGRNSSLQTLKLSRNPITTSGACGLLLALQREPRCGLHILELLDIEVSPQFDELLDKVKLTKDVEVIHGGYVSHADPYMSRGRSRAPPVPGDPLALLMGHVKRSSLRLMDFFAQLDKDNSMSVSRTEFRRGMSMAKIPLTDDQINKLMDQLDVDKDGEISYGELLDGQRRYRERERRKAHARSVQLVTSVRPRPGHAHSATAPRPRANVLHMTAALGEARIPTRTTHGSSSHYVGQTGAAVGR